MSHCHRSIDPHELRRNLMELALARLITFTLHSAWKRNMNRWFHFISRLKRRCLIRMRVSRAENQREWADSECANPKCNSETWAASIWDECTFLLLSTTTTTTTATGLSEAIRRWKANAKEFYVHRISNFCAFDRCYANRPCSHSLDRRYFVTFYVCLCVFCCCCYFLVFIEQWCECWARINRAISNLLTLFLLLLLLHDRFAYHINYMVSFYFWLSMKKTAFLVLLHAHIFCFRIFVYFFFLFTLQYINRVEKDNFHTFLLLVDLDLNAWTILLTRAHLYFHSIAHILKLIFAHSYSKFPHLSSHTKHTPLIGP